MPISKQTRNLLAYIIGTVVVIFGTILLVALANGWQYDFATGEIRETGLVIINSEPTGATITVDGTPLKSKSPYRYTNVQPGNYEIGMTKDGYRPWLRKTLVEAEQVSFDDYAWLIPNEVPSRTRYGDYHFTDSIQSIDRKRTVLVDQPVAAAGQAALAPRLLVTTDWSRPPAILYAPTVAPTDAATPAPTQVKTFDGLQLSADGSNLLVRQTLLNGTSQYLVLPTSPSDNLKVTNLTTSLTVTPSWLQWGPTGNNELWLNLAGRVTRYFVNDQRLDTPLTTDAKSAEWSQDKLLTVETQADGTTQLLARDNGNLTATETIGPIPVATGYSAEYFRWLDHDYIAVLPAGGQFQLTRDVFTNKSARVTSPIGRGVTKFTVNRSGRYLVYDENNRFVSIDFERTQRARWQADLTGLTHWDWINDQHLVMKTNGQLRIIDFDGQNNELIASNIVGTEPLIFADNKSILSFTQSSGDATRQLLTQYFLIPDKIIE